MRSVSESWNVLSQHFPTGVELPGGASNESILFAEGRLGVELPADLLELYLAHNGTGRAFIHPTSSTGDTHRIYPIGAAIETYSMWCKIRKAVEIQPGRRYPLPIPEWSWWEKIWLPITASRGADGVFVCLSSESNGQVCQVKDCFSTDINVQIIANDTREWLDQLASRLFSGKCRFDAPCPTLSLGPLFH